LHLTNAFNTQFCMPPMVDLAKLFNTILCMPPYTSNLDVILHYNSFCLLSLFNFSLENRHTISHMGIYTTNFEVDYALRFLKMH
jgi:hypothetical protein